VALTDSPSASVTEISPSLRTVWLALTITPSRQMMPLDGIRRRAWIATMDLPADSTAAASCDDNSERALTAPELVGIVSSNG
jgi:hypothetical protein